MGRGVTGCRGGQRSGWVSDERFYYKIHHLPRTRVLPVCSANSNAAVTVIVIGVEYSSSMSTSAQHAPVCSRLHDCRQHACASFARPTNRRRSMHRHAFAGARARARVRVYSYYTTACVRACTYR